MGKRTTGMGDWTIGLDLSDKTTEACVLDGADEAVERFRVRTTPEALERALARFDPSRVILEVGTPRTARERFRPTTCSPASRRCSR